MQSMRSPLEGMRVLDFTEYGAGPWCTMLLGDLGADVIKVERPGGDGFRSWAPMQSGEGSGFLQLNRNKRSIILDMALSEHREAAKRIALQVDVLVENYRPGVMAKSGIAYEQLKELNPKLIYCSISGYGQTGPMKDRGGFDLVLQGHGGLMSVTGEAGAPPVKSGVPIIDFGASAHAVIGVLAACLARGKTDKGQHIDISLLDVPVSWLGLLAAKYWSTGEIPRAMGSAHPLSAPYQAFAAADGYITIAAGNQALWASTCDVLGLNHLLDDPRFANNNTRAENQRELAMLVQEVLQRDTCKNWIARISARGVPCGPIASVDQVLIDPQVLHRKMVLEMEDPELGTLKMIGSPIKMSGAPTSLRRAPPRLGQHTDEIAAEFHVADLLSAADRTRTATHE